jgi:diguanylate cyclase (GGDEF)-like protein
MRVEELLAVVHPEDLSLIARASREALKGAQPVYAAEHRVKGHDGQWRWIISRGRVTERDPATGRALRMIGTNFDITERRRAEEASQSLAHTDVLTGLPNRRALDDRLRLALARAARNGREAAVLFLDLDGFKQVNDRFGHAAGDELLRAVAGRLRAAVRATDTVARQGGDEFIVLLEDIRARANAVQIAEKIIAEARRPIDLAGERVSVSASVGIAYGDALASAEDLLKRADAALYEAKGAGRNGYRVAP